MSLDGTAVASLWSSIRRARDSKTRAMPTGTHSSGSSEDTDTEEQHTTVDLSEFEFEVGTLYWFRVSTDDLTETDPSVRYRPRVVEEVEEDRVTFDAGYLDLSEEPESATGRRFKVSDSGFSRGNVLDYYESDVLPGAVLRLTVEDGPTREVQVVDTLYGSEERYYVRETETDALYYLQRESGTLTRSGDMDPTHVVENAEGVRNGSDPSPLDSPTSLSSAKLQRSRRGSPVEVVYHNGHSFAVARDEEVDGFDFGPAREVAADVLDGRYSVRRSSFQISVEWDDETDEIIKVLVRDDHIKPSLDRDDVEDELRTVLTEEVGLSSREDPFEN